MKPVFKLGLCAIMVTGLVACSGGAEQRRQAKDDFSYLQTTPLSQWQTLPDQAPYFSTNYQIPEQDFKGEIGKNVDIRPPRQVLDLVPGARIERDSRGITVAVANEQQLTQLWETVERLANDKTIPVETQAADQIDTGWIAWEKEDSAHQARFRLSRLEQGRRFALGVNMIDSRAKASDEPLTPAEQERYNTLMTNLITVSHDAALRAEARRLAAQRQSDIPMSFGTDRSGLPVIIARAPYDVVWEKLPEMIKPLGFTVESRNQSQGTVKTRHVAPNDERWQALGVEPISLPDNSYTLLLGDLGNRTSINVTDSDGKPVKKATLEALSPALKAAIAQLSQVTSQ
ncbi:MULTISPECIES: outer membrane protein assembly factor BamC [unclassified Salinivibrio]|uniref:outer membrane protein assembly factor BamC n=1 Tax=unclassified Salinivibrio TaxID=2636825 RepID=UPI00098629B6|nr:MULTISPECIES: outer membrane protein assembly factor BamC [unclassified Salinivibrio]OOE96023.1 outer membrane protein assembly factor BamC [Salinivibrio sp. AR640]OOF04446.1 outer membrane protein assembly factor BamC [Salinivibrio sp. MA607]